MKLKNIFFVEGRVVVPRAFDVLRPTGTSATNLVGFMLSIADKGLWDEANLGYNGRNDANPGVVHPAGGDREEVRFQPRTKGQRGPCDRILIQQNCKSAAMEELPSLSGRERIPFPKRVTQRRQLVINNLRITEDCSEVGGLAKLMRESL